LGILLVGRWSTLGVRAQERGLAGVIGGHCAGEEEEEGKREPLTRGPELPERERGKCGRPMG
jgi:hypothetical protein